MLPPLEGVGISVLFCYFYITAALGILVGHFLVSMRFDQIPSIMKELYLFGKVKTLLYGKQKMLISFPKRWFSHFYGFGLLVHTVVLTCSLLHMSGSSLSVLEWVKNKLPPQSVLEIRKDEKWLSPLAVLSMQGFQMVRRLYECLFISSFSDSSMSLFHYVLGIFFYSSMGIGLLSSFHLQRFSKDLVDQNEVSLCLLGFSLFAVASFYQHKTMLTFASLRSNKKENPKLGHYLPKGHLFKWISSPHYLCEIIIYLSLAVIFGMHNTFLNSVLFFVAVNQTCAGLITHDWFKKTFKDYPLNRKAIFPFIL